MIGRPRHDLQARRIRQQMLGPRPEIEILSFTRLFTCTMGVMMVATALGLSIGLEELRR